jgi:hypothetical protein
MIGKLYFGLGQRNLHAFTREIIKPSSSTPHHLKQYNITSMDTIMFRNYMPHVLFFPSTTEKITDKSRRLKQSLSETLAAFYPFAGRLIPSRPSVHCNDEGVEYQESHIRCTLAELLKKYEDDCDLDSVFPPNSAWESFDNDSSPLIVRVNYFDCGGVAIAVCMSHMMGDAGTTSDFMHYWAATSRQSPDKVLPHYLPLPSNDDDFNESPYGVKNLSIKRRRYLFKNSDIAKLKSKVFSSTGQNPTRFEFLATLFYKAALTADKSIYGSFRPSVLSHPVNMRPKLVPPVPENTVGNWIWRHSLRAKTESGTSWTALIDEMKIEKKRMEGMTKLDTKLFIESVVEYMTNNYKTYFVTSLCHSDLYKVNFGWGTPIQYTVGDSRVGNDYEFLDTPNGDGIEVLASFEEQDMVKDEVDKEIELLTSIR